MIYLDVDTSEQIMELTSLQNKIGAFIRKLKNDMDNESKKS
jgi:acetolactate synthase small subunit